MGLGTNDTNEKDIDDEDRPLSSESGDDSEWESDGTDEERHAGMEDMNFQVPQY